MLQDGVTQSGRIAFGVFTYFQARISEPDVDFRVEVTPLTGDVDLYVGLPKYLSPENLPSRSYGSHIWRQATLGADALNISHNDPQFCYDWVYTIVVFGYRKSTFTILEINNTSSPRSSRLPLEAVSIYTGRKAKIHMTYPTSQNCTHRFR
jgi:hypothetical protein